MRSISLPRSIAARGALLALCLMALAASSPAAPVRPVQGPGSGGIDVGLFHSWYAGSGYTLDITFGGVSATNVHLDVVLWDPDNGEPRVVELHCTVPPHAAGTVDVVVNYVPIGNAPARAPDVLSGAFTYLGAPVLSSISPSQFTYKNDQRSCTIKGTGFPLNQTPEVYFGDLLGANVAVNAEGTKLTVTPPPFPGGPFPLVLDVTVVTKDNERTVLPKAFVFTRLTPTVTALVRAGTSAWRMGNYIDVFVEYFPEGTGYAFMEGKLVGKQEFSGDPEDRVLSVVLPALPPNRYALRIVNGDGGEAILNDAVRIFGAAEARFHTADLDENYQLSLLEILRVIQLYNLGGLHCDDESEDGYAPGLDGDHTCAAHSSDYDPQNWKITLPELLEVIQFYNLNCYKPCDEGSGFCPPV